MNSKFKMNGCSHSEVEENQKNQQLKRQDLDF